MNATYSCLQNSVFRTTARQMNQTVLTILHLQQNHVLFIIWLSVQVVFLPGFHIYIFLQTKGNYSLWTNHQQSVM
jgi:hypothetical protein